MGLRKFNDGRIFISFFKLVQYSSREITFHKILKIANAFAPLCPAGTANIQVSAEYRANSLGYEVLLILKAINCYCLIHICHCYNFGLLFVFVINVV